MKQIYDEIKIKELYESLLKRLQAKEQLTPLETKLGAVTGYAVDAVEYSRDIGHPLDLFELPDEETISNVLIALYMYYSKSGNSSTKSRELIAKEIGSYLLFAFCNVCNTKGDDLEASPSLRGNSLYLEIKEANGTSSFVDIFSPIERFSKNNLKYDKAAEIIMIKDPNAIITPILEQVISILP